MRSNLFLWPVVLIACRLAVAGDPPVSEALGRGRVQLEKRIESILTLKKRSNLQAGISVVSLTKGDVVYSHDADRLLVPASVNKILTAYSFLKRIKPTGTFKTSIYSVQPIKEGTLTGDLYLVGGGDPSLVSERMWMMVNDLLRKGIKKIAGNIIGDASYFDTEGTPKTRPTYLKDEAYNAPIGALSFNFNTTTIFVNPSPFPNTPPVVYIDPENSYIDVVNQATTGSQSSKYSLNVSRIDHMKGDLGDTILLRGNVPLGFRELRYYRNIVNPTLYTCQMFREFLERRNVQVTGNVVEGKLPSSAKLLIEFDSLPAWQVVWGMNKFSNNFVADQIMKKLGAEVAGPPGTLEKGIQGIQEEMEKIGIARNSYTIADGSGLTRQSALTANQIVTVLKAAHRDFAISPEFISSLGVAGADGTVKRRFSSTEAQDVLRAKTGTLDGVAALAGFTPSADGELFAFAILLNDKKGKYGRMTDWVDQVALAISQFTRN